MYEYLRQRPKSENWASLTPRSSATVRRTEKSTDPGNSLALGLQRGVNNISLQCIPWPVACSEWLSEVPVWPISTDLRLSDGSGIRTMIRIGLKRWIVRPRPDICRHAKISWKSMHAFLSNLANRQTDKHRGQSHIPPPLSEVMTFRHDLHWLARSTEHSETNVLN